MTKFHSTVSRRDFMKRVGLGAAGVGAATMTAPVFNDFDDLTNGTSGSNKIKHPWWIKELEFNNPTTEIDWGVYARYDRRKFNTGDFSAIQDKTYDMIRGLWGSTDSVELGKKWAQAGLPGVRLRDRAISDACDSVASGRSATFVSRSPETYGVSKWQGTPAEALKMLWVAGRFFGASSIGVMKLDDKSTKVLYSNDGTRNVVFETADAGFQTSDKFVIPDDCRTIITASCRHPMAALKTLPGEIGNPYAYFFYNDTTVRIQEFLKTIGYKVVNLDGKCGSASVPTLTGIGEQGRGANLITPQSVSPRRFVMLATNLDIEPTRPINAGMHKFCETCKKCALHCPTESMPLDTEPSWEIRGPWNIPGQKNWFLDYPSCNPFKSTYAPGYCGICLADCVFSKFNLANIHHFIKIAVSTTSLLNGFYNSMDDFFGYGKHRAGADAHKYDTYVDDWWDTIGPEHGMETYHGTYPSFF